MPVPEELVSEVYALLARLCSPTERLGANNGWSEEEVVKAYRQSPKAMTAFLDHLATHAGEWFTASEMEEAIEERLGKKRALRGVLGAFGRRVLNRYGKNVWFFRAESDQEEGCMTYMMEEREATWIGRQ